MQRQLQALCRLRHTVMRQTRRSCALCLPTTVALKRRPPVHRQEGDAPDEGCFTLIDPFQGSGLLQIRLHAMGDANQGGQGGGAPAGRW